MAAKNFIFTACAYIVLTFSLALIWHLAIFRSFYERIGYFGDDEPIIALGLLAIVIQGLLVAYAYPFFLKGGKPLAEAAQISAIFGMNTASIHVLAAAAKHHAPATLEWFLLEGLYFLVQFMVIALVLAVIHRPTKRVADAV